jgi:hypothetical protein
MTIAIQKILNPKDEDICTYCKVDLDKKNKETIKDEKGNYFHDEICQNAFFRSRGY